MASRPRPRRTPSPKTSALIASLLIGVEGTHVSAMSSANTWHTQPCLASRATSGRVRPGLRLRPP
eukprot:6005919-Heterocapsa_arctica.AAC.1